MNEIAQLVAAIQGVDQHWVDKAMERQSHLTKPPGSLGRLEEIACRIAGIQKTLTPRVDRKRVIVFAADHGVTEEGVSPYPQEVTAQMVANFLSGGAAINAMAKSVGAEVVVVDIGVKFLIPTLRDLDPSVNFIRKPIRAGTRNFAKEPALTEQEVVKAILLGYEIAHQAKEQDVNLIGLGEMGIGNSTTAAAITAVLTGYSSMSVTGRGTGADDFILARKQSIVSDSVRMHAPTGALHILQAFGGLEIAGLVGVCLGASALGIAVVIDGFIATTAAALAKFLCAATTDYMFAGHLSSEPGHSSLLRQIGLHPLLNLGMRLGEGTGAALSMSIIEAAVRSFVTMATFESAGISDKQEDAKGVLH